MTLSAARWLSLVFMFASQSRKRQRLEQGVVFIDDDDDEPELENEPSGFQSWTAEPPTPSAAQSSSCCVSTAVLNVISDRLVC